MENPNPLKYDTEQKRLSIAIEDGYAHSFPYRCALRDHALPLEQLIAEQDKTIAELREALAEAQWRLRDIADLGVGMGHPSDTNQLLFAKDRAAVVLPKIDALLSTLPKPQL